MARRERRPRQKTYPGPNPEDNQQMLQDIKDSIAIETHSTDKVGRSASSAGSEEMRTERERPESRGDRESRRERKSPPGEHASPGSTPRSQQNRSTPTKQLGQLKSERNKKQLRDIRKSLRPWVRSDPGFHASRDDPVNSNMLDHLISLGHSEVGEP